MGATIHDFEPRSKPLDEETRDQLVSKCQENGWLQTEDYSEYDMRRPIMKTPVGDDRLMEAVQSVYKVAFSPEFIARRIVGIRSWEDVKFIGRAAGKVFGHLLDFKNS